MENFPDSVENDETKLHVSMYLCWMKSSIWLVNLVKNNNNNNNLKNNYINAWKIINNAVTKTFEFAAFELACLRGPIKIV